MRIIILSASTGGGHMKASSALKSHICARDPGATVEIVDTLEYVSPLLNKTVTEGYEYIAKKTPKMYGAIYKSANKETPLNTFVSIVNQLFSKKLLPLLKEFQPDIIITTHPFSTEMASNLKGMRLISVPIVCIMTDYAPHKTWINKNVDAYVVSNDNMVEIMEKMGVNRELIHPFGIPIEDTFRVKEDRNRILAQLGLRNDIPTVLIMAGSFGVTDILKIYKTISQIPLDFQIIVITGKNQKLYDAFAKLLTDAKPSLSEKLLEPKNILPLKKLYSGEKTDTAQKQPAAKKDTKLLFFTDEVYKYMQVADLIITKPGGLTVSEAIACNLPMAVFNAIPGQEEENADFLINNNMAVRLEKGTTCLKTVEKLLSNHEELAAMRASCEHFGKANSNDDIFALLKGLAGISSAKD